jgi:hypothetical protein
MLPALAFCLCVNRYQSNVQRLLVVVIVRQPSMHLSRRQVWIVGHDLRGTVTMRDMIRDDVDHSVSGSIYAGPSLSIKGDVGIDRVCVCMLSWFAEMGSDL